MTHHHYFCNHALLTAVILHDKYGGWRMLDDDELNEICARNDDELFKQMDRRERDPVYGPNGRSPEFSPRRYYTSSPRSLESITGPQRQWRSSLSPSPRRQCFYPFQYITCTVAKAPLFKVDLRLNPSQCKAAADPGSSGNTTNTFCEVDKLRFNVDRTRYDQFAAKTSCRRASIRVKFIHPS
jgi:hypothetical protein